MSEAALRLDAASGLGATMTAAVDLAVMSVRGCDAAAISLVGKRSRVTTPAHTERDALRANVLQYHDGLGPSLDAVWGERLIYAPDVAFETRWPGWGQRIGTLHGLQSVMCSELSTRTSKLGALNLYSRAKDSFDERDQEDALTLATLVAVALNAAQKEEQLHEALAGRTLIGQAVGIVMERYSIDADNALSLLTRVSSHSNVKVRDIAAALTITGSFPGIPAANPAATPSSTQA